MQYRISIGGVTLMAALVMTFAGASAFDQTKYPDWKGQWRRAETGAVKFDTSKPQRAQEAPLTPEYQAIFEANLRDQDAGGQGIDPTYTCLSPGMPRIMNIYEPMEIVITPDTTHILTQHIHDARRIFTDGRDFPTDEEPTFAGYSIGKWIDTDGDGRYDELEVETRNLRNPRTYDATGLPFHADGETVIKERIYRGQVRSQRAVRRDHHLRPCADAALDGDQEVPAQSRPAAVLARDRMRRGEQPCGDRQAGLHDQRRRLPDAGQEEPAAAGPALFQAITAVMGT